jgi:hypothetical protein
MSLRIWADDAVAEATGRHRRRDPVRPVTGGPAGNARLTAWLGALLLTLFLLTSDLHRRHAPGEATIGR